MSASNPHPPTHEDAAAPHIAKPEQPVDFAEKGRRRGEAVSLDRRLFMKFTAFTGCPNVTAAVERLALAGVVGVLYLDANDPHGIGIMAVSEDENFFVTRLREIFNEPPFNALEHRPAFDMLGRTYAVGYEPDLEEALFAKPLGKLLDPNRAWGVWYPLRRAKGFQVLPAEDQRRILTEHGTLAKRYGSTGSVTDVRLACQGLDRDDNDFIVGLLGPRLHPLSAVVQAMRATEQTAHHLASLGPFFVGKAAWQSPT